MNKNLLTNLRNITLKFGTLTLLNKEGKLDGGKIEIIAKRACEAGEHGKNIIIVTSGAVACGREIMDYGLGREDSLILKQGYAGVGQVKLMEVYRKAFEKYRKNIAQLLLTNFTFGNKKAVGHLINVYNQYMANRVVPIVNENDVVAVEEIRFGDNDTLAAKLAPILNQHLLLIFGEKEGLLKNGKTVEVGSYNQADYDVLEDKKKIGSGGLDAKLGAMKEVNQAGIYGMITNFRYLEDNSVMDIIEGNKEIRRSVFLP